MALRLLHALTGVILRYGVATGPFFFNLVFDLGAVFALLALGLTVALERSLRPAWPLLLVTAAFPALVGLFTLGLPDRGATSRIPERHVWPCPEPSDHDRRVDRCRGCLWARCVGRPSGPGA